MKQLKQVLSPLRTNTTRVTIKGNNQKNVFCVEFNNKLIPDIFKENGIIIPEQLLK